MDINELKGKAKDLSENMPENIKDKASDITKEADKHIPEDTKHKAKGILSDLKDKLGF